MALMKASYNLVALKNAACHTSYRNLGISAVILQNTQVKDPIQKLFVDKIKEYTQLSKSQGGKLVGSPEVQKEFEEELNKVEKQYGGGHGVDLTKFPSLSFKEPKLDPISMETKQ